MSVLDERLINKIKANTEKIGDDLREFPENTDGDYLIESRIKDKISIKVW